MWWLLACQGCPAPDSAVGETAGDDSSVDSPVDPIQWLSSQDYRFDWAGYEVSTYEVADLLSPAGKPARFHLLHPKGDWQGGTLVLNLHGGGIDDDSEQAAGELDRCGEANAQGRVEPVLHASAIPQLAAEHGWLLLAPENPWCDGWFGLGDEDPVDTGHRGFVLADRAVAWVQENYPVERVVVVGHSLGSLGTVWYANHREVAAILVDSGPPDVHAWYTDPDYSSEEPAVVRRGLEHVLGTPSEAADRYAAASLVAGVPSATFHLYSSLDPLSIDVQHEPVEAVLAASGQRYVDYDADHLLPKHPQTVRMGALYASVAGMRFLAGDTVVLIEGEDYGSLVLQNDASGGAVGEGSFGGAVPLSGEVRATFFVAGPASLRLGEQEVNVDVDLSGETYSELPLAEVTLSATNPSDWHVEGVLDVLVLSSP